MNNPAFNPPPSQSGAVQVHPANDRSSLPPGNITWPMVAYAMVREMPYLFMIAAGCVVGVVLLNKSSASAIESIGATIAPAIVAALAKSRPAESEAVLRQLAGGSGILAMIAAKLTGHA